MSVTSKPENKPQSKPASNRHDLNVKLSDQIALFDAGRWAVACREMQVRIMHGHYDGAVRILKEFCANTTPDFATMDSPVVDVIPLRIANMLESIGCDTVRALDKITDRELLAIPGFADRSITTVRVIIRAVKAGRVLVRSEDDDSAEYERVASPEHRIYMLVLENGPMRAADIAKRLDMTMIAVNDAFHRSNRLTKTGQRIGAK